MDLVLPELSLQLVGGCQTGQLCRQDPFFSVQNIGATNSQGTASLQGAILEARANGDVIALRNFVSNGSLVSSDERFKAEIKPVEGALGKIRQMNGRSYSFKQKDFPSHNFPSGRTDGFIAQELQKVMPEAVVKQPDGYYAVNYDAIIPVLVEAVKQLDAK